MDVSKKFKMLLLFGKCYYAEWLKPPTEWMLETLVDPFTMFKNNPKLQRCKP